MTLGREEEATFWSTYYPAFVSQYRDEGVTDFDVLERYDDLYERRKDLKREAVHYRVTFEKKPFSPIGEVGWNPAGDCDGIASNVYLHDAIYGFYKTGYKFDPHDEVYTVRKGPKKWTRNYASALLKGLGYDLV